VRTTLSQWEQVSISMIFLSTEALPCYYR
jgi:hypothetical protein